MDNSQIASLPSVIKQGIDNRLKDLHTSMPGIVKSFNPVTQLASVQPAIRRVFITRESDVDILTPSDLPLLINVPVIFPRGGGYSLTFPVAINDECLLVFCERDFSRWYEFSKVDEPGSRRFHSLSDAVAYVGLSSKGNVIPNYSLDSVQLKKDDGTASVTVEPNKVTVSGDTEVILTSSTKVTINSPETTITGNLEVQGDSNLSSTVTSGGVDISGTHTHSQANDSGGNTEQDTGAPV